MTDFENEQGAAVLMVCILAFNILARVIGKYLERRLTSE